MSNRLPPNTDELLIGACLSSEVPESVSTAPAVQQFLTSAQPFSPAPEPAKHKRPRVIIPTDERPDASWLQTAVTKLNKSPSPTSQYRIERPPREDEILPSWLRESVDNLRKIKDELSPRTKPEVAKESIGDVSWLLDARQCLKRQVKHTGISPVRIELDKNMAELHLAELENSVSNIGDRLDSERDRLENSFTYFYEEEVKVDVTDATARHPGDVEMLAKEAIASSEGNAEMFKTKEERQRELAEKFKEKKTSVKCDIFLRPEVALGGGKEKKMVEEAEVDEVTIEDLDIRADDKGEHGDHVAYERDLMINGPKQAWNDDNLSDEERCVSVNAQSDGVKSDVKQQQTEREMITVLDKQALAEEIEMISKKAKENKRRKKNVDASEPCDENVGLKLESVVPAQTPKAEVAPKAEDKRNDAGDPENRTTVQERNTGPEKTANKRRRHRAEGSNDVCNEERRTAARPGRKREKKKERMQDIEYDVPDPNRNVRGYVERPGRSEIVQREEAARRKKKKKRRKTQKSIISWSTRPGTVTQEVNLPTEKQHVNAKRESQADEGISPKANKANQRKGKVKKNGKMESSAEAEDGAIAKRDEDEMVELGPDMKIPTGDKLDRKKRTDENGRENHAESKRLTDVDIEPATAASGTTSTEHARCNEKKESRNVFQKALHRIRKLFSPKAELLNGPDKSRKRKTRGSLFSCLSKQGD